MPKETRFLNVKLFRAIWKSVIATLKEDKGLLFRAIWKSVIATLKEGKETKGRGEKD